MKLFVVRKTDHNITWIAACTTKEIAVQMIKDFIEPTASWESGYYDEDLEIGHAETMCGYSCDLDIIEVFTDTLI